MSKDVELKLSLFVGINIRKNSVDVLFNTLYTTLTYFRTVNDVMNEIGSVYMK